MPGMEIRAVREELSKFQQKLAPAPVDPGPVQTLFDRLAAAPLGQFHRDRPNKDGSSRVWSVSLFEIPVPPAEGMVQHAVYRRAFTYMEATVETVRQNADGTTSTDGYKYEIGLDGLIVFCARVQLTGHFDEEGAFVPDEKKSRVLRMSPSDPSVQQRWKNMLRELLTMGPTFEA